ncbi:MAG: sensor histidine kinase [Bacteroidia bacterium]|nr:sensor histidine kinase [Bacteroidia bacterium]
MPPFWKTWWFYSLSLMLTLGGIFVFFKLRMQKLEEESNRKTEMISAMVHAQETERKRIAVDLHDGVGNLLSSIKMNLSALETEKEKLQNDKQKVYENAVALIDDACKDLRAISHNMMPGSLVELGLIHALEEQFDKVSAAGEFKINFKITGFKDRLAETVEVVLYRVIQEIFNNILKHADATKVNVLMVKKKSEIKIDVIDNGNGFDMSKNKTKNGIGLSNIESRVGYLNGTVEFESRKNEGTRVLVQIPIKEN